MTISSVKQHFKRNLQREHGLHGQQEVESTSDAKWDFQQLSLVGQQTAKKRHRINLSETDDKLLRLFSARWCPEAGEWIK